MKTTFLLILSFLMMNRSFGQAPYLSDGMHMVRKADSIRYNNSKKNDPTFSITENTYATSPLKGQKTKGTVNTFIYQLKNEIFYVSYSVTHTEKIIPENNSVVERRINYQIYYKEGMPFYVIRTKSEAIQKGSETISSERTSSSQDNFYMDGRELGYQSELADYALFKEEIRKIVPEIEQNK